MSLKKYKKMTSSKKILIISVLVFVTVLLIFYFRAFFSCGVFFEGTFLKKEVVSSDTHYKGKSPFGSIHITVKGLKNKQSSAEVIYRLPNNITEQYTVNLKKANDWDSGFENIKAQDGTIVLQSGYLIDNYFFLDSTGKLLTGRLNAHIVGRNPYDGDYVISLKNVLDFAYFTKDKTRGRLEYLFLAMFLIIITAIDIRFPMLFFHLRHSLDVVDPEPSDLYLFMQKIGRVMNTMFTIGIMLAALKQ